MTKGSEVACHSVFPTPTPRRIRARHAPPDPIRYIFAGQDIGACKGTDGCAVPCMGLVKYRRQKADWMGGRLSTLGIDESKKNAISGLAALVPFCAETLEFRGGDITPPRV